MWRNDSLFGHSEIPEHHAAIVAETHASWTEHIFDLGEHVHQTAWGDPVQLCRVCHAELQPHEYTNGVCGDTDFCCWRALSERCCW